MRVIGIDPSSHCTGVCVAEVSDECRITDLVHLESISPPSRQSAIKRIGAMQRDLAVAMQDHGPADVVVIETPGPRQQPRAAVYGMAVGACLAIAWQFGIRAVEAPAGVWTKRRKKFERAAIVAQQFPQYAEIAHTDPGGDIADAIGVVVWYVERERGKQ